MNTAQVIQFKKASQPKEADMPTENKDRGYTPLPNFICDEGYLATLDGDAIKCLVFLNRHVKGFHMESKALGEPLVMKITGIKDKRTVRKRMAELAKFGLIEIIKSKGVSNSYKVTFNDRKPTEPVTCHATSTSGNNSIHEMIPVSSDVPRLASCDVPTTSDTACHSVKEIDLKENLNKEKKDLPVDKFESNVFLNSVEYHGKDKNLYSLRELSLVYKIQSDFKKQAKSENLELTDEFILSELKNFAQWSTGRSKTTPQNWMNFWIYRIQNLKSKKQSQKHTSVKPTAAVKTMSVSQINTFARKLAEHPNFSHFGNPGDSYSDAAKRIATKLSDPSYQKKWALYLRHVGYEGPLVG